MKKLNSTLIVLLLITSISTFSQMNKYQSGYLIFEGKRTQQGYIKYTEGSWDIFKSRPGSAKFKFSKSSKPLKVQDDVIGFVIESDSFVIKKNIVVNNMARMFDRDFVKVKITGPVNAFLHTCTSKSGAGAGVGDFSVGLNNIHYTWILCKGNHNCITINNPKKQKDRIIRFFADNEIVKNKLEESKPGSWDIEELVKLYKETKS